MLISDLKWKSKATNEASVLLKKNEIKIWCSCHPYKLSIGETVNGELYCICSTDLVKVNDKLYSFIRTGELSYELTGMVLNKNKRMFFLGGFKIEFDTDFPEDIHTGDFIQFHCLRIEIR